MEGMQKGNYWQRIAERGGEVKGEDGENYYLRFIMFTLHPKNP
jgi:hypothetical protein